MEDTFNKVLGFILELRKVLKPDCDDECIVYECFGLTGFSFLVFLGQNYLNFVFISLL